MIFNKVPLLVWFLIPTLIIIGLGVWFLSKNPTLSPQEDQTKAAEVSQEVEGTQVFDIVSRDHISQGAPGSGYNSNPPASGPHWSAAAKNGVYDTSLADEQVIHNLEHGHVWISYKPDVSDDVKDKLKEIVQKDDWKVVLAPRDKNDSVIALVAWGRVLAMDEPDYAKIEDFIKVYRNRGPEKTPE